MARSRPVHRSRARAPLQVLTAFVSLPITHSRETIHSVSPWQLGEKIIINKINIRNLTVADTEKYFVLVIAIVTEFFFSSPIKLPHNICPLLVLSEQPLPCAPSTGQTQPAQLTTHRQSLHFFLSKKKKAKKPKKPKKRARFSNSFL